MDQQITDDELTVALRERFKKLPPVVQRAITSADVEKHLRELAETQKLHIDQWQLLENEVMQTLLGFQPVEDLKKNIQSEVGVSEEVATILAESISKIVFEPIREELERGLVNSETGAAAANAPASEGMPVAPATPPQPPSTLKVERAPVSAAYKSGEPSTVRTSIEDDPYREPPA